MMILSETYKRRLQELAGIEIISEDYRYEYKKTYVPNDSVIRTAKEAIDAVSKNKLVDSNGSNEGSGLSKAQSILNKEPMTHAQLKRMKAFFDNNFKQVEEEKANGRTVNDSSILQSWNLWGGDEGKRWVEEMINQMHDKNDNSKTIRGSSGIRTKNLMNPNNTRTHSALTKSQNSK